MKVTTTRDHIDTGLRMVCHDCVLALAIGEELVKSGKYKEGEFRVAVLPYGKQFETFLTPCVEITGQGGTLLEYHKLTEEANKYAIAFDLSRANVKPCEIEVWTE